MLNVNGLGSFSPESGSASQLRSRQEILESGVGTQRIEQFENADVHVWKAIITPNAPLTMHRHEHPRVLVALDGGNVNIVQQAGGSELIHWETGNAYWLPASKPGTMHTDSVVGRKPLTVMVVELKNAQ